MPTQRGVRGAACAVSEKMRHFNGWGRMNLFKKQEVRRTGSDQGWTGRRLAGWAAIAATMLSTLAPLADAQQQQINPGTATEGLPPEPAPNATLPVYMRPTGHDYRSTPSHFPNPIAPYLS